MRQDYELERAMELSGKILNEMKHRNEVEKEADKLLANGQYKEADQLLNSLDYNVIRQLREERNGLLHYTKAVPEHETGKLSDDIITEKEILDKLCLDNLCNIQQGLKNQMNIIQKVLYAEIFDITSHMVAAIDLCSNYSNLIDDLLKAPNEKIDVNLIFSHFSKISETFNVFFHSSVSEKEEIG